MSGDVKGDVILDVKIDNPVLTPNLLTKVQIQEIAEQRVQKSSSQTSWIFGIGFFIFFLGIILLLLIRSGSRWVGSVLIVIGLIFMCAAAAMYAFSGPDKVCAKNPNDLMCATRYK